MAKLGEAPWPRGHLMAQDEKIYKETLETRIAAMLQYTR